MTFKTGVDIIRVSRIASSIKRPRFLSRIYGPEELKLYEKKPAVTFLAGNFAAKEAFSKALGTGIRGFAFADVEVLRDDLGAPFFLLSGNALKIAEENNMTFSVSISHDGEYAIAFVIAYIVE